MDDAVERYLTASSANVLGGLLDAMAPDGELVSPISGHMVFRGREDLEILLPAIYGAVTGLTWGSQLARDNLRVAIGRGRVGPLRLDDAMVFELAADGRIQRIRPHLRPWLALTVFALRIMIALRGHPGVVVRALKRS